MLDPAPWTMLDAVKQAGPGPTSGQSGAPANFTTIKHMPTTFCAPLPARTHSARAARSPHGTTTSSHASSRGKRLHPIALVSPPVQGRGSIKRQWHPMRPTHLHAERWDRPHRTVEVEFGPLGQAQFTRSRKQKRKHLQRDPRTGLPVKGVDGTQQSAKLLWISDRGTRRWLYLGQSAPQSVCRIDFGASRSDRVSEHTSDRRLKPSC